MSVLGVLVGVALCSAPASVVNVFEDKGDLFIRAGKNQSLKVGVEVRLLGDPIGDTTERRTLGKATVMEVWDTIARVVPEDAVKGKKPQAAALPGPAPGRTAPILAAAPTAARPVASDARSAAAAPARREAARTESSGGITDHLTSTCAGTRFEVRGTPTYGGVNVKLYVGEELEDARDVSIGGMGVLQAQARGKPVRLEVQQGLFGTDYALFVGNTACELADH